MLYPRCDEAGALPRPLWSSLQLEPRPKHLYDAARKVPRRIDDWVLRKLCDEAERGYAEANGDLAHIRAVLGKRLKEEKLARFRHPISLALLSRASAHACIENALNAKGSTAERCLRAAYAALSVG